MSMEGFEPRISGLGSDRFATCATTTAYQKLDFQKLERYLLKSDVVAEHVT